MAKRFIEAG